MQRKLLAICLFIAVALVACKQRSNPVHEQTSFAEDQPMDHPVPVSQKVLELLSQREEIKDNLRDEPEATPKSPAECFSASQIHLGPADELDLIVKGNGVGGADAEWFWVIRSADKNPVIILWAGGNGLKVLPKRTNGFHDIQSDGASASTQVTSLYQFNGTEYKLAKKKMQERHD